MVDTGKGEDSIWPMPTFSFRVSIGSLKNAHFQEVSGLDTETLPIEYRHGTGQQFSTVKMPGIAKFGNVTLKRGIVPNENSFRDWCSSLEMNTVARTKVVIKLLDESSNPVMTWTLNNAWPTKLTGPDLKAEGDEIAIETLEIAHEGLVMANE